MKRFAIMLATIVFAMSLVVPVFAQEESHQSLPMQMYHVVLVEKGPNWKSQATQEGMDARMHAIENIRKGAKMGLFVTAGLVNDETDVEFIVIMNVETKYEALEILHQAPSYKNGQYTGEIFSMFAPKGLVIHLD